MGFLLDPAATDKRVTAFSSLAISTVFSDTPRAASIGQPGSADREYVAIAACIRYETDKFDFKGAHTAKLIYTTRSCGN